MWYRVFDMISVTKGANRRRLCMVDLQIFLDGFMDTYGINCNYRVYKRNDIIFVILIREPECHTRYRDKATACNSEAGIPEWVRDFSFLPNIQTGSGAHPAF